MEVFIECIQGTKDKYELKDTPNGRELVLDRQIKRSWISNYGSILYTLQADGDELDTYVIGKHLIQGERYKAFPICMLYTIDNGVADNKLITVVNGSYRRVMKKVKAIIRFVDKYKQGSKVYAISWKESNIIYEIAKCKAFYNLFKGE